jgi:hypothetical protein
MESQTKIEVKQKEMEEPKNLENRNTKSKVKTKNDPKVRMSYIVPEEIYPENIDI